MVYFKNDDKVHVSLICLRPYNCDFNGYRKKLPDPLKPIRTLINKNDLMI